MNTISSQKTNFYRPEIDGLRAISIALLFYFIMILIFLMVDISGRCIFCNKRLFNISNN